MRNPLRACALAPLLLLCAAAVSALDVEVGLFFHDLSEGQDDWQGERIILRGRPNDKVTAQLEIVDEERGDERGQLVAGAGWVDLTPNVYAFAAITASDGTDFFPEKRVDLELHYKVHGHEQLVLFGGGGAAEFSDSDVTFWTSGVTLYHAHGVLSYRYYSFDNDAHAGEAASSGNGSTHILSVLLGREETGQLDLRLLYGDDFLRDFSLGGGDARLRSRVVYAGWRRLWSDRWGTLLQAEWGDKEDTYTRRGLEVRLLYRGGKR
jgi:YaiO family outer membrane protein